MIKRSLFLLEIIEKMDYKNMNIKAHLFVEEAMKR
jgi:hypothetical protein